MQHPPVVAGFTRNVQPGLMTTTDLAGYRSKERVPRVGGGSALVLFGE